jgi:hypothetical protein
MIHGATLTHLAVKHWPLVADFSDCRKRNHGSFVDDVSGTMSNANYNARSVPELVDQRVHSTALAAKKDPDIFLDFTTNRSLDGKKFVGWSVEEDMNQYVNTTFTYDIASHQITINLDRSMSAGRPTAIDEDDNLYLQSSNTVGRLQIMKNTASGSEVFRTNFGGSIFMHFADRGELDVA